MAYFDITEATLTTLGYNYTGSSTSFSVPSSMRWDCSLGGLPFLFGFNKENPFRRETADFRRDRVDTQVNPGEQSLDSGKWLKSQASWHYGEGLLTAEPYEIDSSEAQFRYKEGGGVDPWIPGKLSLLKDTVSAASGTGGGQHVLGVGSGKALWAHGIYLKYVLNGAVSSTVAHGASATISSLTTDGSNYFVSDTNGIRKGSLPAGAGSALWTISTQPNNVIRWVKDRLMAGIGPSLYELVGAGPTLPAALFTHPDANWTWTDIAEGPTAIYAAGYSNSESAIYKIAVTATTSTITLSQPVVIVDMPRGEKVNHLYSYVGTFLIVGGDKGCRVASINTDGSLTLGPLLFTQPNHDAVALGSYVYCTVTQVNTGDRGTRAGLIRIDLSTSSNANPLSFAWASDVAVPSAVTGGKAKSVTYVPDYGLMFTADGTSADGLFTLSTNNVAFGWVETGRIRMGTIEGKAWRDLRIQSSDESTGSMTAYASTSDDGAPSTWTQIVTLAGGSTDTRGSLTTAASTPQSSIYLAFKLTNTTTDAPVMTGYQVSAIPAPDRTELVEVPVMMYDFEVDRQGNRYGRDGGAYLRYKTLKEMENAASTISFRDFTTGETAEAYVERVSFVRSTPPTRQKDSNGGICKITLRLV